MPPVLRMPYGFRYPTRRSPRKNYYTNLEGAMKNPLDSLWGTVISGVVLTIILYNVVRFALQ